jgi:hypothetical protein
MSVEAFMERPRGSLNYEEMLPGRLMARGTALPHDHKSGKLMTGDNKKNASKAAPKEKAAVEPQSKTPTELRSNQR